MNKRLLVASLLAAAVAGCGELEMGPSPDTRVQPAAGFRPPLQSSTQPAPATTQAASPTTYVQSQADASGKLRVSVDEAILLALENNAGLRVDRYNPLIAREAEQTARAVFDPTISGTIQGGRTRDDRHSSNVLVHRATNSDTISGKVGVSQFLPTGTTLSGELQTTYSSLYSDDSVGSRAGLSVTQSLLQGNSIDANLASLRQARIDTRISQYELRGTAESLVSDTEQAYWNYALDFRKIEIYKAALDVAQQQLNDTLTRIRVGNLAQSEQPAAEAEVASRKQDLVVAYGQLGTDRLKLLQLMSPGRQGFWNREIEVTVPPFIPDATLQDVETHVNVALKNRPDVNEARLRIQRNDLEVVRTKNGLLPKLDLFVDLGKTGYAKSFGGSFEHMNGQSYDALVGITGEYAIGNRAARASYAAAKLTKDQARESLTNLEISVQYDVRNAYLQINTDREQITAAEATRRYREQALVTEQAKFRVGNSTNLLVAQAQRDLVDAQIGEITAVTTLLKDLVNMYQLEGSLLTRRRIEAPGSAPAELPANLK